MFWSPQAVFSATGLKQPFSQNLGLGFRLLVLKHSFPSLMIYISLFVFLLHYNKVTSWKLTAMTSNYMKSIQSIVRTLHKRVCSNKFSQNLQIYFVLVLKQFLCNDDVIFYRMTRVNFRFPYADQFAFALCHGSCKSSQVIVGLFLLRIE